MAVISLKDVLYVSLYTGNNGPDKCTCKCPCCSQSERERSYQGNIQQVLDIFDKLPNLKQLYVFGNPDVTVDTDFCHQIFVEAVKRNIHICFSTSGVGGEKVLKKLLKGIQPEEVDYISLSFDATTEEEMSFMKGIKYPMEKALQGLDWAIQNGYTVKIQPTLWSCNYSKAGEIIEFFNSRGVKWFTFHVGSLESGIHLDSHQHLTREELSVVHKQISEAVTSHNDIKVRCPTIYKELGADDSQKWYCMHPERTKELLVMLTKSGIKATHVPMASCFKKDLSFELSDDSFVVPALCVQDFCPFSTKLSGSPENYCRYVSKFWNY